MTALLEMSYPSVNQSNVIIVLSKSVFLGETLLL